ncbi:MAG: archaellin/type IV pilin N-terminal domain-containing protein [Nitrososphaerota archaeon]
MVCSSFIMMVRSRSGISPVVATVILVAVAIVIAIAVAFWASGLVGIFTRFEKLEITSAYYDGNNVVLLVSNTGSADTSIDEIYINGRPCQDNCGIHPTISVNNAYLIKAGTKNVQITIRNPPPTVTNGQWIPGTAYEVAVHTASGKTYPASVLIP